MLTTLYICPCLHKIGLPYNI